MVVGGLVGLRVTGVIRGAPPVQDSVQSAHHLSDHLVEVDSSLICVFMYFHSLAFYMFINSEDNTSQSIVVEVRPLASSEIWTERICFSLQVFPVL